MVIGFYLMGPNMLCIKYWSRINDKPLSDHL